MIKETPTKTSSKSRSPISLFNTAKWQVGWWHILRQYWYINVKLNNLHKFNIDVSTTCWARTDGLPNVLTEKIIGPSLDQRTPERFFRVGIWVGPKLSVEKISVYGKKIGGSQIFSGKNLHFRKKFGGSQKNWWKNRRFWKKFAGGYQMMPETNFRHRFCKYLPDPPPWIDWSLLVLKGRMQKLLISFGL